MKPELQRIAIAEACGWKMLLPSQHIGESKEQPMYWQWLCNCWDWINKDYKVIWAVAPEDVDPQGISTFEPISPVPDYLNDLNAMHEAEKILIEFSHYIEFVMYLNDTVTDSFPVAHATASQRAEAFIRTLNLWTE